MSDTPIRGTDRDVLRHRRTGWRILIFIAVAIIWLIIDMYTKALFTEMEPGTVVARDLGGLFNIVLVHNTGAAWGILNDSTIPLGILSVIVCIAITVLFFANTYQARLPETIGMALIVGGGIGNALDRFLIGYVIDFIEFNFIDFPVFNVADIGVTCGFVIFFIGLIYRYFLRKD